MSHFILLLSHISLVFLILSLSKSKIPHLTKKSISKKLTAKKIKSAKLFKCMESKRSYTQQQIDIEKPKQNRRILMFFLALFNTHRAYQGRCLFPWAWARKNTTSARLFIVILDPFHHNRLSQRQCALPRARNKAERPMLLCLWLCLVQPTPLNYKAHPMSKGGVLPKLYYDYFLFYSFMVSKTIYTMIINIKSTNKHQVFHQNIILYYINYKLKCQRPN